MKKLFRVWPVFLLLLFIQQSCMTEKEINASFDESRQHFSGPSYSGQSSCSDFSAGENLGMLLIIDFIDYMLPFLSLKNDVPDAPLFASTNPGFALAYQNPVHHTPGDKKQDKNAFSFKKNIRLLTGLEFVNKKSKDGTTKVALHYLETPIYGIYIRPLGPGRIFGGLGPYLAYGVGGKTTYPGSISSTEVKSFDEKSGFKRFDAGLGFTAGYKMTNGFSFSLGYELGLANIDRNAFGDKTKNRSMSLNVGYSLDKLIARIKK